MIVNLEFAEKSPEKIKSVEYLDSDNQDELMVRVAISERCDFEDIREELDEKCGTDIVRTLISKGLITDENSIDELSISAYLVGHEDNWSILLTYHKI